MYVNDHITLKGYPTLLQSLFLTEIKLKNRNEQRTEQVITVERVNYKENQI